MSRIPKFRRAALPLLLALIGVVLSSCAGLFPWGGEEGFVRVRGTHFELDGRPYYYAGSNLWYGCYLGSPGDTGDRERLCRELDSLRSHGLENLRIMAASEESYLKRSVRPAIQRAPGDLNDSLLQGLDYLLAQMAERRMHAVLFLNNYWQWSGGMAQYNVWANGGPGVDPDDTSQGYGKFMAFSARFYSDEKANALFRNFVRTIVTRRNTVNGRVYAEDPTIMSWQLANEPRPGTSGPDGENNLVPFYLWIESTAAYIHSLDTNHLVSSGSEGAVAYRWSDEFSLRLHGSKHIDYVTFHLWPLNWGWFDPVRPEQTLEPSVEKAIGYVRSNIAIAARLGKPLVLEEFGFPRDSAKLAPGTPVSARDRYYGTILGVLEDSAAAGAPIAGSNFWGWGGLAGAAHPDGVWRKGDPFTGDPPQEPQGFNSIFLADTSTIRILHAHAFRMRGLRETASRVIAGTH